MKSKYWLAVLLLLYLSSLAYCFFIGVYETLYSLGVYVLIAIQGIGLLVFFIHLLVTRLLSTKKVSLEKSLIVSLVVLTAIHLSVISYHRIEQYKPTYSVSIPDTFKGAVYLFNTPEEVQDVIVSEAGIGYIGSKGKREWKFMRAGIDITDAYVTSHMNEIAIYEGDSTRLTAYDVQCLVINDSNIYPKRNSINPVTPCMGATRFLHLVQAGFIDESKLRKGVWNRSENGDEWIADVQRSRW